jgi:hypothetical protein
MQKFTVGEEPPGKFSDAVRCATRRRSASTFSDSGSLSMKILGIELSKPSFGEVTAAAVMAAGLWLAAVAAWRVSNHPMDRIEAGAALLVIFWACVGVRMGIRFDKGPRHVAANMLCAGVILAVYQGIVALLA